MKKLDPLIVYDSNKHLISLNNWQDEYYFIKVLPILFLFWDNKYLTNRKTVIPLKICAKWAMVYHICQYVGLLFIIDMSNHIYRYVSHPRYT